MRTIGTAILVHLCLAAVAHAQPKTPEPKKIQFGINPEGITSPAMREALTKMQEAGVVEGRRGSLSSSAGRTASRRASPTSGCGGRRSATTYSP